MLSKMQLIKQRPTRLTTSIFTFTLRASVQHVDTEQPINSQCSSQQQPAATAATAASSQLLQQLQLAAIEQ
jgi:hypothetical protein